MMLFRRIFFCALLAGICAGLTNSVVQHAQVIPIIAAAETFESQQEEVSVNTADTPENNTHTHGSGAWEPHDGIERSSWTVLTNILGATGFALLLVPAFVWWSQQNDQRTVNIRTGLLWGLAGWFCVFVWPALGLQPELPGEVAAALHLRQAWWLFAVLCAIGALAILTTVKGSYRWCGLALLPLPFLVGAPHVNGPLFAQHSAESAAQLTQLKTQFLYATTVANGVNWLVLGSVSALAIRRWLLPCFKLDRRMEYDT